MKSAVIKRSIIIAGHETSVSLEDAFWKVLKDVATTRRTLEARLNATFERAYAIAGGRARQDENRERLKRARTT